MILGITQTDEVFCMRLRTVSDKLSLFYSYGNTEQVGCGQLYIPHFRGSTD